MKETERRAERGADDRARRRVIGATVIAGSLLVACASIGPGGVEPLRLSELEGEGDPARAASLRLVVEGLEFEIEGDLVRAEDRYARAVQIDPNNPYAYLAMARHEIEAGSLDAALRLLDRTESLLLLEGDTVARMEPHLVGLRGSALYASGEISAGIAHLQEAAELAPEVWGDGHLDASELL